MLGLKYVYLGGGVLKLYNCDLRSRLYDLGLEFGVYYLLDWA